MEKIDPNAPLQDMVTTSDERTLALLAHVLTFIAGFIAPLIVYLVKKDESPFVRAHAAASLNFQITLMIAMFVGILLSFILIGIPLLVAIGIGSVVLVILATVRASEGKPYTYPLTITFVR